MPSRLSKSKTAVVRNGPAASSYCGRTDDAELILISIVSTGHLSHSQLLLGAEPAMMGCDGLMSPRSGPFVAVGQSRQAEG